MSSSHQLPVELPVELVHRIVLLAAEDDRHCAYALAFVSRAVCQWTAKARLKTIVITTVRQYVAFAKVMLALPDAESDQQLKFLSKFYPSLTSLLSNSEGHQAKVEHLIDLDLNQRHQQRSYISFPKTGFPHKHIRNLFFDLIDVDETGKGGYNAWLSRNWETFEARVVAKLGVKATLTDVYREMSKLPLRHFWTLDLNLDHLTLGPNCEELASLTSKASVEEITIVDNSNFQTLDAVYEFLTFQESVRRIHIIGIDSESNLSGVNPPWEKLARFKRFPLTHIRYDTRKFSFKPAEIFASRLRPLLQEVTIKTNEAIPRPSTEVEYKHAGPRHAAPSRGAGNRFRQTISSLTPIQHLTDDNPYASFLKNTLHEGSLDFLQFAWEPMDSREKREEDVPWHVRARFSHEESEEEKSNDSSLSRASGGPTSGTSSTDTGGWPRERRGAWTERSDRDLAPSFAVELRDAIHSLYGWDAPGIEAAAKFSARKDLLPFDKQKSLTNVEFSPDGAGEYVERIKDGMREEDKKKLRNKQTLLRNMYESHQEEPSCVFPELQFGVRAPRSLIHLGGKVPYEVRDRLALFEDRARGGKGAWP